MGWAGRMWIWKDRKGRGRRDRSGNTEEGAKESISCDGQVDIFINTFRFFVWAVLVRFAACLSWRVKSGYVSCVQAGCANAKDVIVYIGFFRDRQVFRIKDGQILHALPFDSTPPYPRIHSLPSP
ncbi:hypothetical protein DPSP01_008213 [Paraphaeosphaeria sporulosa]